MGANEGYSKVKCTCGEEFDTFGEYLTHAFSAHGINAEDT